MTIHSILGRAADGQGGRRRWLSVILMAMMAWPLLGASSIELKPKYVHDHDITIKEGDRICFTMTDQDGNSVEVELEITDRDRGDVEGTWEMKDADGNVVDSGTFSGQSPCCTLSGEYKSTDGGGNGSIRINRNNGKGRWSNTTTGDSGKITGAKNCEEDDPDCDECSLEEWTPPMAGGFI